MKVIHTFVSDEIVWKEQMYVMVLSALYAKKHYGDIALYCSNNIAKQFSEILPIYDEIKIIDSSNKTYSVPKLKVYSKQTESFLHLDHDSILFDKIPFDDADSPFVFSHPDMKTISGRKGKLSDHIPLLYGNNKDYRYIKEVYLELIDKLSGKYPQKKIPFASIPNMAVVYVNDSTSFSSASQEVLNYYSSNKDIIDNHNFGAHHLEQFLLHHILFHNNNVYKKASKKFKSFVFPKVPFTIEFKDQDSIKASIKDTNFPFTFTSFQTYPYFNRPNVKKNIINSPEDIKRFFGNHFGGYIHLSYLQWYQIFIPYILNEIESNFGIEYIESIHNHFRQRYLNLSLPRLSEGELLYGKLSNFSF